MTIEVQVPADGYLKIIGMGRGDQHAMVLFPNELAPDNRVHAGVVTLPGDYKFVLEQDLPEGMRSQENEMLVVFTQNPVNFYAEGEGKGDFRNVGQHTRSTVVRPVESSEGGNVTSAAGFITYTITR
jgi:hypothetical protein